MPRSLLSLIFVAVFSAASSYSQSSCPSSADPQVSLSGVVSDPTGATLRDAHVTLLCGDISAGATTDATGQYSVQLPAGTYKLSVAANGFTTKKQSFEVLPN